MTPLSPALRRAIRHIAREPTHETEERYSPQLLSAGLATSHSGWLLLAPAALQALALAHRKRRV